MPTIYRAMFADGDLPMVGRGKKMLGVKIGHQRYDDIGSNQAGEVVPGTGGMSVAPEWRVLPDHRIPRRLNPKLDTRRATGDNRLMCWRYGSGGFETSPLTDDVSLAVDSPSHGVVEPSSKMSLARYEQALAATAPDWTVDEE
jgi:hypothetical protein